MKRTAVRDPPQSVRRSNRRQACASASRRTGEPEMIDLAANSSPSTSPPSSPLLPRPPIVTPLLADSSPLRARRMPHRPPSPPPPSTDCPPSPPPTSNITPPSSPPAAVATIAPPPSSPPVDTSPNLGGEVSPISSHNLPVEGLTTSDSSEDENFVPPKSPSTVLSPSKLYFLTWYDQPCAHMPEATVLTDSTPHIVEDEIVGLDHIEMHDREEVYDTPHSEADSEANIRNLTPIPTKKIKGLGRIFAAREFYAEACVLSTTKIKVWGVRVSISAKAINKLLGLSPPAETDFETLSQSASFAKLEEIGRELGKAGTGWDVHSNYMLRTYRASNLNPDANVWMNFI
ncbi:proline-rich receptor-like protein kinase PERK10 [Cynara cardunculus var. scolymus]|uniref:proline-rich receptor-like protein kinase PERK10 n=1 Tax=Cynara cardunculus var. scolymus TaxID=59895 RepID=UPI000D62AF12|nr:proline-rich receptor-like protein kinase PERK10 [Cynara cardunculus var. scolymus]